MTTHHNHNHNHNHNHIFNRYPIDPTLYVADVAAIAFQAIERYGMEEWRYATLTCELHSHVGIYSLLGVKMGLRAREAMVADVGEMRVVSYAGNTPPISCLNDGLQVSTGSTLGHGLIEVANNPAARAEAIFRMPQRELRLALKQEHAEIINRELALAKARHGMGQGYWNEIRRQAIKYWLEWDRTKIFDVIQ